ncbi:hypothetical protein PR003_g8484 [Phytophthora rubi]|uniref:Uncharacterized protein n=1 Tax=Phytophthora rubi TaxID=129364 RepID=A0A6A4FJE3_9STRA|nr:hypothetical protein PR002_g8228 [Phytophthora rubi]KAE9344403.1 hypothetical protein PR003_g8484 [Phytophthora rubi]
MRYLLDDVLDRKENQLGDSLTSEAVSFSEVTLEGIRDVDYASLKPVVNDAECVPCGVSWDDEHASTGNSSSVVDELKAMLLGLRDTVKVI